MTTSDYLTQLQQDREDLVDNLETMGITGLSGDETFTELVPEVLNISGGGGADLSDYFLYSLTATGLRGLIKKIPTNIVATTNNLNNAFANAPNLEEVPYINTTSATLMASMFSYCSNLKSIALFDMSNVINCNNMFASCSKLTTVPQFTATSATNMSNMFSYCPALTDNSLNNILAMCISATSLDSSNKTLSYLGFTSTNYPASRIQALSNYQDFIDAGWTIGY